jgi:hypothetical protein
MTVPGIGPIISSAIVAAMELRRRCQDEPKARPQLLGFGQRPQIAPAR